MKKRKNRGLSLLLLLTLLLSLATPAMAVTNRELETALDVSGGYIRDTVSKPQVSTVGGEWTVIGLARSGCAVPQSYWEGYHSAVEREVKACKGVLHQRKYTEYSRVVVALTAIGADPRNVAGYDLLKPLGDFEKTVWQGINGSIWALIALDAGSYDVPANPEATVQATRQMYVDEILACQLEGGGWNLTDRGGSGRADPDITGMALQALAKYQSQSAVKTAVSKAVAYLSAVQDPDGGYDSYGSANSESVVQVIVGLCELGISMEDPRFVKSGGGLLDSLLSYRNADGSFRHVPGGDADLMASEQGLYALAAAVRASRGENSLYRMGDTTIAAGTAAESGQGLAGKHADVTRVPVSIPGITFPDTTGHANQTAVEQLAARGVITGFTNGSFGPDQTMTRAQFAAVVVRALGLPQKTVSCFTDVKEGDWHAAYVGTAYTYGIVNGRTAAVFDPSGTITRQEAAAMVARAARLCGMDTAMEDQTIRNVLAQFGDYMTSGTWARESLAFCYSQNILDQSDLDIEPHRAILRCEIAQMVWNLLDAAQLL